MLPFGACIGSFLNVVIYRLPRGQSLMHPPSHCPHCDVPIKFYDNIPILGWLLLRGRARCCGEMISPRYPLVELLTGFIWALIGYVSAQKGFPVGSEIGIMLAWAFFTSVLIAISFIDIDLQIIPDELSIGGTVAAVVLGTLLPQLHSDFVSYFPAVSPHISGLLGSLCGALTGAGVILFLTIVGTIMMRRQLKKLQEEDPDLDTAIGYGDVKLMAFIGAFIGWKYTLVALLMGCVYGAIGGSIQKLSSGTSLNLPDGAGVLARVAARWESGTSLMPFGPYLCAGALTTFFFGGKILLWLAEIYSF